MIYQGLVNEGATCYLNSLLQTLFMTYEFRENVYSYHHNPKKIAEKDSIPYQLQKLFILLQTKNCSIKTKDLLKSFQWNEVESFEQHDVQQFCRILFEALEKSHKNSSWIKNLFGGSLSSYINCGTHISKQSQMFLDISLPIRNSISGVNYRSIEECILEYLRPQKIEEVECSQCKAKVTVQKGLAFESLPNIFTIQLNRFELNFQTMQREKINSFLYFPQLLQLHRFTKPFAQIKLKGLPKDLQIKSKIVEKQKSHRTADIFSIGPQETKIRKKSDEQKKKVNNVIFYDAQNPDKRTIDANNLTYQQEKERNKNILADLKSQAGGIGKKMEKAIQKSKVEKNNNTADTYNVDDDPLFGIGGVAGKMDWTSGSFEKPKFQKTEIKYEHEQEYFDPNKQYPDYTYALYAVLVHAGGSYGGHYFAYINDGKDWYKFDDNQVTKVTRNEMRKYGNNSAAHGTNAYLLFYRDVKGFKDLKEIKVSQDLVNKINLQVQKQQQTKKVTVDAASKRYIEIHESLIVKVYKGVKDSISLTIKNKKQTTLSQLRLLIKQSLKIEAKDQNWRIRRYNYTEDTMHEIYGEQISALSLDAIGFRQQVYLTVEYKTDDQVFEGYDSKKITVKINVWKPNIIMVSEKKLKPIKIHILQDASFGDLYKAIIKQSKILNPLIIKRNFSVGNPINKLIPNDILDKKLIDLRFFNGINLYVEENDQEKIRWSEEFETERFRCLIKFNHPKSGEIQKQDEIYFDTRKTLKDLKQTLSEIIGLSEQNFRIKKNKQALAQMTSYKKKLSQLRFINTQYLYLQQGKSSKGSIIIKRGEVGLIDDRIEYSLFEETQYEISAELNIVADLINKISQQYMINAENIRIRQYKNFQFKEIFSRNQTIQKIRQKSLIWQKVEQYQRGLQIYYRLFNILSFQFGPLKQLYIDSSANYEQFVLLLEEEVGIPKNKLLVYKPLSNYITLETMLDCEWVEVGFLNRPIREDPLHISCDGDILIIKQADKEYKQIIIAKTQPESSKAKGQAQLKITVIAQNEQGQEKVQQNINNSETIPEQNPNKQV